MNRNNAEEPRQSKITVTFIAYGEPLTDDMLPFSLLYNNDDGYYRISGDNMESILSFKLGDDDDNEEIEEIEEIEEVEEVEEIVRDIQEIVRNLQEIVEELEPKEEREQKTYYLVLVVEHGYDYPHRLFWDNSPNTPAGCKIMDQAPTLREILMKMDTWEKGGLPPLERRRN